MSVYILLLQLRICLYYLFSLVQSRTIFKCHFLPLNLSTDTFFKYSLIYCLHWYSIFCEEQALHWSLLTDIHFSCHNRISTHFQLLLSTCNSFILSALHYTHYNGPSLSAMNIAYLSIMVVYFYFRLHSMDILHFLIFPNLSENI